MTSEESSEYKLKAGDIVSFKYGFWRKKVTGTVKDVYKDSIEIMFTGNSHTNVYKSRKIKNLIVLYKR